MDGMPSQSGMSSEDDDFEGGDNQIKKKDDIDIEDEDKFKNNMKMGGSISDNDPEAITTRDTMTLQ